MATLGLDSLGDVWSDVTGQTAAKDAANATKDASNKSIALQREMWQKSLDLNKPFYDAGVGALGQLQALRAPSMDIGNFKASPDYNFRLQQGQNQILSGAGAQGMRLSGATLKALNDYGQNTASQEYSSWYGRRMGEYQDQWNRLAQMAGIGQTANSAAMGANQNAAAGISQQYQNIGNANAAVAMQGYNGFMNLLNLGAKAYGMGGGMGH